MKSLDDSVELCTDNWIFSAYECTVLKRCVRSRSTPFLSFSYKRWGRSLTLSPEPVAPRRNRWLQAACFPEKWFRNFAQDDKWNFCLTAGTLVPANQERP